MCASEGNRGAEEEVCVTGNEGKDNGIDVVAAGASGVGGLGAGGILAAS